MQVSKIYQKSAIYLGLLFIFLFQTSFTGIKHPYYIGVTEIRLDTQKNELNVGCKLNTDDLQEALYKLYKAKVNLMKKDTVCNRLMNVYIKERLKISINKQQVDLKFSGYELEEESCWCYFESKLNAEPKIVQVSNTLLYDFIHAQTNLIHCYLNKERKSYKLANPKSEVGFEF
ncbi:MAG: hypothetical protein Q8M15_17405 [Bacteroidota bacterium]|nr:hypothetical protein [Bacteroidota bacterium]